MSLSGTIRTQLAVTHTKSGTNISAPTETAIGSSYWLIWTVADGSGADQANLCYAARRTLVGSTSEDLDLAGGLTDNFGNTLTFVRVKALYIRYNGTGTGNLSIGGAASNAFASMFANSSDILVLKPGGKGSILFTAPDATGYVVTAGTGDILKVANGDVASATYDIVIIGASS